MIAAIPDIIPQSLNDIPVFDKAQQDVDVVFKGKAGHFAGANGGNCNLGSQNGATVAISTTGDSQESRSKTVSRITFARTTYWANRCPPRAYIIH